MPISYAEMLQETVNLLMRLGQAEERIKQLEKALAEAKESKPVGKEPHGNS